MDEPEFKLWDRHHLIPLLRFADIEASGLHQDSYPMQFAWCGLDLKTTSIIVKPEPEWTAKLLAAKAVEMHGITHEAASRDGVPAGDVADRLNDALAGTAVVVDSPSWDGYWTTRLFDTVGVAPRFGYNDFGKMAENLGAVYDRWCVARHSALMDAVDHLYPHTHRADEDALRMAALTRMFLDREWAEWLLDHASSRDGAT